MKILIELPSWLGDAVMTTPAIENIINYYDDSQVTLIGSTISVEALKHHPKVKRTYVLKKNLVSLYKLAKNLGEFDAFFSFRSSFRARVLKLFIQSHMKYQIKTGKYNDCHHVEKYNRFINNCLNTNFSAGKLSINRDLELKINQLLKVKEIDQIILSTDDKKIIKYLQKLNKKKIKIDIRPKKLASSKTKTENFNAISSRNVYFVDSGGFLKSSVYDRENLSSGKYFNGPAIIDHFDTTTLIPRNSSFIIDSLQNIIISLGEQNGR